MLSVASKWTRIALQCPPMIVCVCIARAIDHWLPQLNRTGLRASAWGVTNCLELQDKSAVNSGLKIQALLFLKTAMARSAAEPWQPYLSQLSSSLFKAVGERYYKIAAEALRACEQLIRVIRPSLSQTIAQQHLVSVWPCLAVQPCHLAP